ncbi:MAG: c-type cytochrome [Flavobacteriaceae bacterium]|nr:c-type cytochrome [Psychroflexus sp.]
MENFKFLAKRLAILFGGIIGLIVVIFIGIQLYQTNPDLFRYEEIADADWKPRDVENEMETTYIMPDVRYGYEILTETQKHIGPQAKKPEMRYAGNNLKCTSCHIESGNLPGGSSWAGVTDRYPKFGGRSNSTGDIKDRVNGCMERSMNGEMIDRDSREMRSIVAYMEWLGDKIPESQVQPIAGFAELELPNRAVDLNKGKKVYMKDCTLCHKDDGQGVRNSELEDGYQYPPLWGEDSYNEGAGMHRVITASKFIKANMPYLSATRDEPVLTDEEAYDVAGYINSFDRPSKPNKEDDFPDRKLKPVSTPYAPWADDFSAEQHKYGPFKPIIEHYIEKHDIKKSK